jgi:hypothetical protein
MFTDIDPKLWGPPAWQFLYYLVESYPINPSKDDKEKIVTFIVALANVLPCEKCRKNFKKDLVASPLTDNILSSQSKFKKWIDDVRLGVKKSTEKTGCGCNRTQTKKKSIKKSRKTNKN